jgi:hypothetical protein
MPSYQNQPAQQAMQQDALQTGTLAHLATAYQGDGQMYYQEQQPPQGQQLQEQRQQQGQQQGQQQEQEQQQGQQQEQQQKQQQEQQSMADAGLGDLADEMGNDFYPEFLYQYSD